MYEYKCNLKQICEARGITTVKKVQTMTTLSKLIIDRMWNNIDVHKISLKKYDIICTDLIICYYDLIVPDSPYPNPYAKSK